MTDIKIDKKQSNHLSIRREEEDDNYIASQPNKKSYDDLLFKALKEPPGSTSRKTYLEAYLALLNADSRTASSFKPPQYDKPLTEDQKKRFQELLTPSKKLLLD